MIAFITRPACLRRGQQLPFRFTGLLWPLGGAIEVEGRSTTGLPTGRIQKEAPVEPRDQDGHPTGNLLQCVPRAGVGHLSRHGHEYRSKMYNSSSSEASLNHHPGERYGRPAVKNEGRERQRKRSRSGEGSFAEFDSRSRDFIKEMRLLGQHGRWVKALQTFREALDDEHTTMNLHMYNATISVLSKRGRWGEVLSVIEDLRLAGHSPDRYTFNIAILACANGNEPDQAWLLFEEMKSVGITPDIFTYNHLMTSCRGGLWEQALDVMEEMKQAGHKVGAITFNALIVAYGNGAQSDRAVQVLDEMRLSNVARTEGTYCAAISACGKVGQWERALALLDKMKDDNLVPNGYCYNAAIAACYMAGRWQEALELFRQFIFWESREDPISAKQAYRVLQACARAGATNHVRQLIEELRGAGHEVSGSHTKAIEEIMAAYGTSRNRGSSLQSPFRKGTQGEASGASMGSEEAAAGSRAEAQMTETSPRLSHTPNRARESWGPPYTSKKFVSCVRSCRDDGGSGAVMDFLKSAMADPDIKVTMHMYRSVLEWLARRGRPDGAVEVLELIRGAGLTPDAECITWAIKACGRARPADHARAMELVREMDPPTVWGYASAMSACAKGGQWADSLYLLEAMPSVGLHANV